MDTIIGIISIINSIAGLITAITAFLLGIVALRKQLPKNSGKGKTTGGNMQIMRKGLAGKIFGVFMILISVGIIATRALIGQEQPSNVQWTSDAWNAFNKADYEQAINSAKKCINEFMGAANREQSKLDSLHTTLPPTGKVSAQEKEAIMSRGLLNDVATCFYIKGRSAENLGRKEEAKQAYESSSRYTYARCWDPKGWF